MILSSKFILYPRKRAMEWAVGGGLAERVLFYDPNKHLHYNPNSRIEIKGSQFITGIAAYQKIQHLLPEKIVVTPMSYQMWRKYSHFHRDKEAIVNILEKCIRDITPYDIDLLGTINRLPIFWSNLYKFIESISDTGADVDDDELGKKVEVARMRYNTLDGVYDLFIFTNFREIWDSYINLDYYDRIDFLAMTQVILGIDVRQNLELFRIGAIDKLKLDSSVDITKLSDEMKRKMQEQGVSGELLHTSSEELKRAVAAAKSGYKSKTAIDFSKENTEFLSANG